jgi:RNA polymerase sigma-70 factor, ECF subfamily
MSSQVRTWELCPQDAANRTDSRISLADVGRPRIPQTGCAASASRLMDSSTDLLCALMERYAAGEDAVFEHLYHEMAPRLYGFCRRLATRRADTDDCFQETFLKIHRARATYVSGSNPLHWAFAVARSVYLTRARYWRRHPERLGEDEDVASRADLQPQENLTPEAESMAADLLNVAVSELNRMPESHRVAYILLKEEGLSAREAAAVLGITEDSVRQRAHRAYERIRRALAGDSDKQTI